MRYRPVTNSDTLTEGTGLFDMTTEPVPFDRTRPL